MKAPQISEYRGPAAVQAVPTWVVAAAAVEQPASHAPDQNSGKKDSGSGFGRLLFVLLVCHTPDKEFLR